MNAPNAITVARLLSVPVFVWLILRGNTDLAFWVFVAAALSDAVDGILAKRFGMATVLGAYLDPIADKALLVSAVITLGMAGMLPLWLVILIVSRDIVIVGGALVFEAVTGALNMEPLMISKVNTCVQLGLVGAVLAQPLFALPGGDVVTFMVYATGATTLASGAAYMVIWLRRAQALERGEALDGD